VKGKMTLEMVEAMLEGIIGETISQEYVDRIVTALSNTGEGDVKNTLQIKKIKEPKEPRGKKGKKSQGDGDDEY